jgi:hypothetical protein
VGPIQPLRERAADHPLLGDGSEIGGQLGRGALGLLGTQAVEAAFQGSVEPALDAARRDAEVLGDVLMRSAARGEQDDLGAIAELAVGRGTKDSLQTLPLGKR